MKSNDAPTGTGIYRSRKGIIFGVCRGLAEHFDFSVVWARAIAVMFLFISGLWPAVGIYLIATLIMKPAPVVPLESDAEREFYDSYTHSRHMAAQRLKRRFENLERRIRRMEHIVTTREFDWEDKL
ncbi:MAG: PspC domain-containing protein [Desulfobacterales bacterium]|nr:PspC domain-containing protein [Desulfobacterales bacterium]